jgi:hypothetical protein
LHDFYAMVTRFLVGSRPFPMILSPLILLSGDKSQPGNKMVLCLPLAHIPSYFTENRHRSDHINAVDLCQVRAGHAAVWKAIGKKICCLC